MSSHPYGVLTLDNGAGLIFTPCPGTKSADLPSSVATLKAAGTDMLITLMFEEEMQRNQAQTLPETCQENQVQWLQMPIDDDAAPGAEFAKVWAANKAQIIELLANKGTIAVHCKGGSGRTGLVIGLILKSLGWPTEKVIETVQQMRPKALVNPVQLNYFMDFTV
ncbi:dual specificity protein phosphatase family protein [Shewanella gaetbuli]|uniref:Dual specificity protein phosphatase family protein n=1 Tax=Shewanella gaetbuli TaxID=220752 RepID=A0A9X2CLF9_9GAMM|nr:dual specificity protein phosphatase family protein [Shewanella gaetbuli]MCL1142699.1 dual specificity protein phosphatase family protein [Shewanella gaetbuli]